MFKSNSLNPTPEIFKNENQIEVIENQSESPIALIRDVAHNYTLTHLRHKLRAADLLLNQLGPKKTLIYCSRKRDKVLLDRFLAKAGHEVSLLDNFGQNVGQVKDNIEEKSQFILIASDGINLIALRNHFNAVIHFDMPARPVEYLARLIMVFGISDDKAFSKESHIIATSREFSVLQILQNNYSFELKENVFAELSQDIPSHELDLGLQEISHLTPDNQPVSIKQQGYGQYQLQNGFGDDPPAFLKVK